MIDHYIDGVPTPAWLEAMRDMESEGERTPAQDDPAVFDEGTPALLRRQAA